MKLENIGESIKGEINKIDGMEVYEGLTESEKERLLPKEFLLTYEPPNDETALSADIHKLQKGLRNYPSEGPLKMFGEIAHSMLSEAVKTQMERQPLV